MRISDWSSDVCSSDLKVAMALFIGLGPMFILCLLFEQTKQLFSKWLFYGIGTMFSLALLSVMVAIALKMVLAVAAAFWVGSFTGATTEGINSMALQQGGLGLILTVLIVTAPPMAASFFQIGRASCRVSVCTYVYLLVVAVYLKKHQTNNIYILS